MLVVDEFYYQFLDVFLIGLKLFIRFKIFAEFEQFLSKLLWNRPIHELQITFLQFFEVECQKKILFDVALFGYVDAAFIYYFIYFLDEFFRHFSRLVLLTAFYFRLSHYLLVVWGLQS